jgi:hypothetical protein
MKHQVRASPQLECWNNGRMGFEILVYLVDGKICLDDKIQNE